MKKGSINKILAIVLGGVVLIIAGYFVYENVPAVKSFFGGTAAAVQTVKGADGINGIDGKDGANGVKGDIGDSAYQTWLDLGHTGTETDFINWLKGADGDKGETGADGKDGKDGKTIYNHNISFSACGTGIQFSIVKSESTPFTPNTLQDYFKSKLLDNDLYLFSLPVMGGNSDGSYDSFAYSLVFCLDWDDNRYFICRLYNADIKSLQTVQFSLNDIYNFVDLVLEV